VTDDEYDDDADTAEEPLYTESELDDALAQACAAGFRKGRESGRARQREETLGMLEVACAFNGSGAKVLETLRKAWDESKVKRNHGEFAHTDGGTGDGVSETESANHGGGGAGDVGATAGDADAKARTLAARIADVPAAVARRVSEWVQARYAKLSARYGETGAKMVLGAMVVLAPTPIPGSSLIPVAVAEAVLRIRNAVTGEQKKGFDPNEKRDESGEWTAGAGAAEESAAEPKPKGPHETTAHEAGLAYLDRARQELRARILDLEGRLGGKLAKKDRASAEWSLRHGREELARLTSSDDVSPTWRSGPDREAVRGAYVTGIRHHRLAVENALKAGTRVPAEVLADYPDLAKKYAAEAAEPAAPSGPDRPTFDPAALSGEIDDLTDSDATRETMLAAAKRLRVLSPEEKQRLDAHWKEQEGDGAITVKQKIEQLKRDAETM
jgi:2-oxo-4-hydroxy-4-carboxy--5-ureidoimidazoline (OHCU) decarboxylase